MDKTGINIVVTEDGSHSLFSEQFGEMYHSRHGALAESDHIFIKAGLGAAQGQKLTILELGFGTGLNALLSWMYAEQHNIQIKYRSIELYPVPKEVWEGINYHTIIDRANKFHKLHEAAWDQDVALSSSFSLHKIHGSVLDADFPKSETDLVFFDAFSPEKQPDLWTVEIFKKMYDSMVPGALLLTYCSKSAVQRSMREAGLIVEKLPGPRGKRDIIRARKP